MWTPDVDVTRPQTVLIQPEGDLCLVGAGARAIPHTVQLRSLSRTAFSFFWAPRTMQLTTERTLCRGVGRDAQCTDYST